MPRWEPVPFNLFYARSSSFRREFFCGTYIKERGNCTEQLFVRIGEPERENALAHSCHNSYMKTCIYRSSRVNVCSVDGELAL